jgi:tetratricopeptide (TPR) repeat protein
MKGDGLLVGALALGLVGGLCLQLPVRESYFKLKETSEAYLLPPPSQLKAVSLGHRAAMADLLWANVLVTQGLRLGERRRYETIIPYLEAITELDPKWRDPYRMADALVTMQAKAATLDDIRATRKILERGVQERPYDAELWLVLGQFVGFIIPNNYLEPYPEEAAEWRKDGAVYLARAAELATDDSTIAWNSIGSARIFAENGQLDRAIEMYQRVLATTEDPSLREQIEPILADLRSRRKLGEGEATLLQGAARREAFRHIKPTKLPGLRPSTARAMPYPADPAACAGGAMSPYSEDAVCSDTWLEWSTRAPYGGLDPQDIDLR